LTLLYEFNDGYVNAGTVCQLLRQIKKRGYKWSVTLVMDNARYQRCRLVQDLAETLGIELLFLPSYSPNLNLIERYWKYLKGKLFRCRSIEKFELFCTIRRRPQNRFPPKKFTSRHVRLLANNQTTSSLSLITSTKSCRNIFATKHPTRSGYQNVIPCQLKIRVFEKYVVSLIDSILVYNYNTATGK